MNQIIQIPFTEIDLDLENPRFNGEIAKNQIDALKRLFKVEKPIYFYNLAEDICKNKLNPGENYLVIKESNRYIVLEGNRRIATLKILLNPTLCPDNRLIPKFKNLSKDFLKLDINKINCAVLPNREASDKWIDLKHASYDTKGVGTSKWSTEARHARHNKKNRPKISAQILEYVCKENGFPQYVIDACKKIDLSTSDRAFDFVCARNFFGYSIKEGIIKWPSAENSNPTKLLLSKFILYFTENNLNVNDVYYSKKTEDLLRKVASESTITMEDMNYFRNSTAENNEKQHENLNSGPKVSENEDSGSTPNLNISDNRTETHIDNTADENNLSKTTEKQGRTRSLQDQRNRAYVINHPMQIEESKLNAIYLELKNKINVQNTPYAASMLLRSFIELSCDYFMLKLHKETIQLHNRGKSIALSEKSPLSDKIKGISDTLQAQGKINEKEHGTIYSEANVEKRQGNMGSVVWLHSCVHNYSHNILPSHVISAYDNFKPLLVAIWEK